MDYGKVAEGAIGLGLIATSEADFGLGALVGAGLLLHAFGAELP